MPVPNPSHRKNEKKEAIKLQQQKRKTLKIIIISIIWLWTNAFSSMASDENNVDPNTIEPLENQYFEMRATEIKEVEGQNKQVVFELWGHDIEFKRI